MGVTLTKGGKEFDLSELVDASGDSMRSLLDFENAQRHSKAMDKIHALVCVRERSAKEVYERLIKADYTPGEAIDAVRSAKRCGLISNERFASAFARGKAGKGWSRNKIIAALKAEGLSSSEIESCSHVLPSVDDEYDNAMRELRRKKTYSKNPQSALLNRLAYRGYSSDVAYRAVHDFLSTI